MRVLGQDSRLSTVLADRFFSSRGRGFILSLLGSVCRLAPILDVCMRVQRDMRAAACVRARLCALQRGARHSRTHTLAAYSSLAYPLLYATMFSVLSSFFP